MHTSRRSRIWVILGRICQYELKWFGVSHIFKLNCYFLNPRTTVICMKFSLTQTVICLRTDDCLRTLLLRDLKWINFNSILRLNEASFMYKNSYVSADSNVKKVNFDIRNKVSQRITRNGSDYRRTAVGQKAVSVSGAKLWNSISMNIRNSNTIVTFKIHMCQHLLGPRASITIW